MASPFERSLLVVSLSNIISMPCAEHCKIVSALPLSSVLSLSVCRVCRVCVANTAADPGRHTRSLNTNTHKHTQTQTNTRSAQRGPTKYGAGWRHCVLREKIVNEGTCQARRYGARYEVRARYRYKYNKTACARQVS